jgi:hypothetical protein
MFLRQILIETRKTLAHPALWLGSGGLSLLLVGFVLVEHLQIVKGYKTAPGGLEAVFIRAPRILNVGPSAKVLATYEGSPVLVEQGRHLAATFHPELSSDQRVHELFIKKL